MSKPSLRVYFIPHGPGRLTGILMRSWSSFFSGPPLSAIGRDEADVYQQLTLLILESEAEGREPVSAYLWEEDFDIRRIAVEVHPQTTVNKRPVIGKSHVPLRLFYATSRIASGAYRVMLPRFDWWFLVEDLSVAPEVLKSAISSALLGEQPRLMYDFRSDGDEYVRAWEPDLLRGRTDKKAAAVDGTFPTVRAVAEEWVEKAAKSKAPLIDLPDHLAAFERLKTRMLAGARPSVLLVGDPGVGKTAFVRRMARFFSREMPAKQGPAIWATSAQRILAGMIYLGMWQERCLAIVSELEDEGDYLYIDRLMPFLAAQPDGSSMADLFLQAVRSESIYLIAECTPSELERARRRLPALVNAMQIVPLEEPSPNTIPEALLEYQTRRGAKLSLHPQGAKRLVQHLGAFQRDVRFPGKAFRFLDWLIEQEQRPGTLYPADVSRRYAEFSGLPLELISDEHPMTADQIAGVLSRGVIGQDEACLASAGVLSRFKAGLNDPDRPLGCLFFVGPTGVGKTELAKQLARFMFGSSEKMIRLDMSEYLLPGSSRRLLEAGEGTRSLAEQVRQAPLSLLLFDEIEKAHPEVFDLLLGVLGEGRLTDSLGRTVDFRMTIIVMTSNLGAGGRESIGFGGGPKQDFKQSVRQHFRPELWSRIDQVISFRVLSPEDIEKIVDLTIAGLAERSGLVRRRLILEVDAEARKLLAKLGYHPTRGARPLKRLIEERVVTPVAVKMAADPTWRDQTIPVVAEGSAAHQRLKDAVVVSAAELKEA